MKYNVGKYKNRDVYIDECIDSPKGIKNSKWYKNETMYIGKAALNIILSNLISNAINCTHEKDTVHIGIEQGYFFIQNKQDPTQSKGNGLGLYIVRNLLDNYKMKYETIEGEKFIFKIKLK